MSDTIKISFKGGPLKGTIEEVTHVGAQVHLPRNRKGYYALLGVNVIDQTLEYKWTPYYQTKKDKGDPIRVVGHS